VVVDTTEFQPDLLLSRSLWLQARLWALKGQLQLWVPEVVIREAVRHYRSQLDQHLTKLDDADDALSKLSFGGDAHPGIREHRDKVAALQTGYEQWLRDRLGRVGAKILPLPQISRVSEFRGEVTECQRLLGVAGAARWPLGADLPVMA